MARARAQAMASWQKSSAEMRSFFLSRGSPHFKVPTGIKDRTPHSNSYDGDGNRTVSKTNLKVFLLKGNALKQTWRVSIGGKPKGLARYCLSTLQFNAVS